MKKKNQKVYKCRMNKNLIIEGIETMNYGVLEIFVNKKPLCYVDLDNFNYDYKGLSSKKFKSICDLLCYDMFNQNILLGYDYDFNENGLREIKENY